MWAHPLRKSREHSYVALCVCLASDRCEATLTSFQAHPRSFLANPNPSCFIKRFNCHDIYIYKHTDCAVHVEGDTLETSGVAVRVWNTRRQRPAHQCNTCCASYTFLSLYLFIYFFFFVNHNNVQTHTHTHKKIIYAHAIQQLHYHESSS